MQLPEGTYLSYHASHEAWHWEMSRNHGDPPQFVIAAQYPEGGSAWSFSVVRDEYGAQLRTYEDGWRAFVDVPEFFAGLAELGDNTTLEQVRALLDRLGAVDETPRVRPEQVSQELQDAERLAEIEAREQAATALPWTASDRYPHVAWQGVEIDEAGDFLISTNLSERAAEDIRFVAHARDDVPWLVGQVKALRAELASHRANDAGDGHATGCSPERHDNHSPGPARPGRGPSPITKGTPCSSK